MTDDPLDAYVDAAARMLGLAIDEDWRQGVRENLATAFNLADLLASFPLSDHAEPAPRYDPDPASGTSAHIDVDAARQG